MDIFSNEDQVIVAYGFDIRTHEFTSSFEYFLANGTGLAANSTIVAPPGRQDGYVAVFDKSTQTWSAVEDHRGKEVYLKATQTPSTVDYLGTVKSEFTLVKPEFEYQRWDGGAWVDQRTDAEKRAAYLVSFITLTKRQFNLYMWDAGLKDQVDALLAANPRVKIEFDSTDKIERSSPAVEGMIAQLGWTDQQVEQMWEQALLK